MKRTWIAAVLALMLAPAALAQATGTQQQQQQQQPSGTQQQQPSGTQQQQQPGATQQPGTVPPATPGAGHLPGTKAQPQAQSQEEYNAYLAVMQAADLATAEAAANDFATKFPNSNLRGPLYHVLMMKYSQAENGEKMIEMGRKAIQHDPDNPVVLALLASSVAETARENDLDFDEKATEVMRLGEKAVQTADTSIAVPPSVTAEQLAEFRKKIKALAHGAMGKVALQKQDFPGAEKHLRQAIEMNQANPADTAGDHLRLSIALDKQQRYPEALAEAKQAMAVSQAGSQVAILAKQQHDRLAKLVPGGAASTTSTPAGAPPTTGTATKPATNPPAQQKPQGTTPR